MTPPLRSGENPQHIHIGIDIGGTFTDFVVCDAQRQFLFTLKLPSTPDHPAQAVLAGIDQIMRDLGVHKNNVSLQVIHGSTVATNALLERKGATCAFIGTQGFKDILYIGRQNRPELYNLFVELPVSLISEQCCFEIDERISSDGSVLKSLTESQIYELIPGLHSLGVESVAVCLLFSFLHPEHEARIAQVLRQAGFFVSVSSKVLPEFREYERASTTAVNAYVSPILDSYLTDLENSLPGTLLRVMQSNGGNLGIPEARRFGVHCILSGPAGGVVGSWKLAQLLSSLNSPDCHQIITMDMGGTSTDVSLIDGELKLTHEAIVGGWPIGIPILDIHTIGAGGGSIAYLDAGGALRVGPQSTGAVPGPACYGHGTQPTVTDANLVLGRLLPENFLGGALTLYPERANVALSNLANKMGLDLLSASLGVIEVANAHMERALRLISVERGHDPRRFILFSFGGAGGLHAVDLARRLGISHVLVSPLAATLSAYGMLAADVIKDYSQTVMLPGDTTYEILTELFKPLFMQGTQHVRSEGIADQRIHLEPAVDMRLRGQSYELTVPFDSAFLDRFHVLHQQAYGYARAEAEVEIVTMRLRAIGSIDPPHLNILPQAGSDAGDALIDRRPVVFGQAGVPTWVQTSCYRMESLHPGNQIDGPALIIRSDTTILLGLKDTAEVDTYGNILISIIPDNVH
jgi:N-methylhydantoinase A